jgi:RNA polymerase-binding transcription factor DksA
MTLIDTTAERELLAEREVQLALVEEHEATALELLGNPDVDSILERELALSAVKRARKAVADIDAALERIADGTFGTCEVCGEAIAPARLAAIPYARRCATCA